MMTFTQVNARIKKNLMVQLLVLSLKEYLVECASVCNKTEVILKPCSRTHSSSTHNKTFLQNHHADIFCFMQDFDAM